MRGSQPSIHGRKDGRTSRFLTVSTQTPCITALIVLGDLALEARKAKASGGTRRGFSGSLPSDQADRPGGESSSEDSRILAAARHVLTGEQGDEVFEHGEAPC